MCMLHVTSVKLQHDVTCLVVVHPVEHNLWCPVPPRGHIPAAVLCYHGFHSRPLMCIYPVISFSVGLARPKSNIFSSQSSLTAIFEGLRSLKKNCRCSLFISNMQEIKWPTYEWCLLSEHTSSPWQSGRPGTGRGHRTAAGSWWCCWGPPPWGGSPCTHPWTRPACTGGWSSPAAQLSRVGAWIINTFRETTSDKCHIIKY